uniref:protein-tyrosine-phosphatase n=1 Tax=Prymnesium polylepis TaxID=72548 RepID=A0A7S4J0Y8_9EUKA
MQNPPSLIQTGKLRFFIMDAPTNENISLYLKAMEGHEVSHWVRCCEAASYDETKLDSLGIKRVEWSFPDGDAPPKNVIDPWLDLCFSSEKAIAIHCVAGLGRAPLLVAIALIEAGIDAMDAVDLIRQKRRGAINRVQLKYLQEYKPSRSKGSGGCSVM